LLKKLNIRAVLTVAANTGLNYTKENVDAHEKFEVQDVELQDLTSYYQQSFDFFDKHRKTTNVYCHCFAGVSRSATIVIAYLMKTYNISFQEALNHTRNQRSQIYPNQGFIRQLKALEQQLIAQRNGV